jgi:Gram-negative bacterial TonB protein C-terminal
VIFPPTSRRPILRKIRGTAVLFLALFAFAPQARPQQQELDELAGEAAAALSGNGKHSAADTKVLVLDFNPLHARPEELGIALADSFSDALKKQLRGFEVADRQEYFGRSGNQSEIVNSYNQSEGTACFAVASGVGANALVKGSYEVLPDHLSLWIEVRRSNECVFEKRITIALTPEWRELALKPAPKPKISDAIGKFVWTSIDHPPRDGSPAIVLPGNPDSGFKPPRCQYCPNPSYTAAATAVRVEGTEKFTVEVNAEGFPVRITLLQGLPCGMIRQAIDAVAGWKFIAATGPDGRPLSAVVPIEITFRTY